MLDLSTAELHRLEVIAATPERRRAQYAQHFTPRETAKLAASLFSPADGQIACLDLGAGTGMLTAALVDRYGEAVESVDCIELDPVLAAICDEDLAGVNHRVLVADAIVETPSLYYDRIILNPPYKKMSASDERQCMLPVPSPNLYTAFLEVALAHLSEGGEAVAIIPRSWTNGSYFESFRRWAFEGFSLDAMHVYGSRTEVFEDTNVLQETMLVRFSRRPQTESVRVTESVGRNSEIESHDYAFSELVVGNDLAVRVRPALTPLSTTVSERGFCPSTGKVVDFRSRDRIYMTREDALACADPGDVYRLVYVGNLRTGVLEHPAAIGKGQWYRADDKKSRAQLLQPGSYVIVKRFSSKEESRRVVAYPVTIDEPVAFENHSTFIHRGTSRNVVPIDDPMLAKGLAMWLDGTSMDSWFRGISGSTQVNAKDIKSMPCPEIDALLKMGAVWEPDMKQSSVDAAIEEAL